MRTKLLSLQVTAFVAIILTGCGDATNSNNKTKAAASDSSIVTMTSNAPVNKFLYQNSDYPIIHFDVAQTDNTPLAMWKGNNTVTEADIDFIPLTWASRSTVHKAYPKRP